MSGNDTGDVLADQFIQAAEKAVGINVVINAIDYATSQADVYNGQFDAYYETIGTGLDPGTTLYQRWDTQGSSNFTGYTNPRLDFVLTNGFKATTTTARDKLYRVAQQILLSDRPFVIFGHAVNVAAVSTSVQLGNHTWDDFVFAQYK